MKIIVFLPCRFGSQRVKRKNVRDFFKGKSLLEIKLKQLIKIKEIDKIILSTNYQECITVANNIKNNKIIIDNRLESLCQSSTSTDEVINYVPKIIEEKDAIILWTHITSPFINSNTYSNAINQYLKCLNEDFDSLMSVTEIQSFCWFKGSPLNYDVRKEKWPRTQALEPIYEINSGFFINKISNYIKHKNRIGLKPYFYKLNNIESIDINSQEQFDVAKKIYESTF